MFDLKIEAKDCIIGVLILEKVHNNSSQELQLLKSEIENEIRVNYGQLDRTSLKALHPMDTYISYYKKFGYSYHVLSQLESVIQGKGIPEVLPLVEAMFMAELKDMLLTAGHDFDKIEAPLYLKASTGKESFITMNGREVVTVSGDFMIADQKDVISSILRGPDQRTAISSQTRRVLYTVYAPAGIEAGLVEEHLSNIEMYVKVFSKDAVTIIKQVICS